MNWEEVGFFVDRTDLVSCSKKGGHKMYQRNITRFLILFIFLGLGVFIASCGDAAQDKGKAPGEPIPVKASSPSHDLSTAIVDVARRNIPAVAHIEVTQRQEVANPFLPFENDPFFRYFFDMPRQMPKKFEQELKGLGTGMIIDDKGHILTNNHVVGGATEIKVLLSDGQEYQAEIVGTDPKTDLGVIKITAKGPLPYVSFGDSDKVEVGTWVVAIGHPRGLDQTVTQGIISAKHRRGVTDPNSYQDFLQTDAAINPGNSGGPLLNLEGDVIGVNAAIASESGGFEGIGFAIPSNMAVYIARALIDHGKVVRGWIGVSIQELTHDMAGSFGLEALKGALIADVVKGGPGDKAGLMRGDIVLAYQESEIPDGNTLRDKVANTPIGQEVKMTVWRAKKKQEIRVRIGNQEDAVQILTASVQERLGAVVRPVTAQEAQKYGIELDQGVAIRSLDGKGVLGAAGFEVGDIILEMAGQPVSGVENFVDMVNSLPPNQVVAILVLDHRSGNTGYIQVQVK
jgi:serine protease Do